MNPSKLTDKEFMRFNRHIMMQQVGEIGQIKLKNARVLVIGMGGLGCPASQYLAASGVGELNLIDFDLVEQSNLQRQILFKESDIGLAKVTAAKKTLLQLNPLVKINANQISVFDCNLPEWLKTIDLVLDCTDNPKTRFFINQCCVEAQAKLVSASAIQGSGQLISFDFSQAEMPCYQCLFRDIKEQSVNCATSGVLGPLLGVLGSLQATQALNLILGKNNNLGRLLLFDAFSMEFKEFNLQQDRECPACGNYEQ